MLASLLLAFSPNPYPMTPAPGEAVAQPRTRDERVGNVERPEVRAARRLWASGRRREALQRLASVLAADPSDAAVRRALVEYELAAARPRSALEHARPLGDGGARLVARALYLLGRYEEALPLLDPRDAELVLMRVEALFHLGRAAAEREALAAAAKLLGADAPEVRLARARRMAADGELAAAAGLWRAALAEDPLAAEALYGLGRALVRLGEREQGLALLERHRALAPLLDALDFAERSLVLAPLHAPNLAATGDAWRALAPYDPRSIERAEAAYSLATLHAAPDELVPVVLRRARLAAEDMQDRERALEVLEAGLAEVRDPRLFVRAADLLADAGRWDEARGKLDAALALRPGDAAIRARLAEVDRRRAGKEDG